jgi:hypothetical protein
MLGSFFMAVLLLCSACDDPVEPRDPPPVHVQQDTTSHDIDWTVYTFGPGIPSSSLHDIIAFSDTNVWAVGYVYPEMRDSTGSYGNPYTVFRWNGREWKKYKVPMSRCTGSGNTFYGTIRAIAGTSDDIWMNARSGEGVRSDGVTFTPSCFQADSTSIYGALSDDILYMSANEIYFAGSTIKHDHSDITLFSNGGFRRIALIPGIVPVTSLVGDGKGNLWAAGYSGTTGRGCFIHRTPDGVVHDLLKEVKVDGTWPFKALTSLWISDDTLYGGFGGYLYIQALYDTSYYRFISDKSTDPPYGHKTAIDGTGDNDVFMVGAYGTVTHYNGKTVQSYPMLSQQIGAGMFYGISVTENYVYVCGSTEETRAAIAIGRKRK